VENARSLRIIQETTYTIRVLHVAAQQLQYRNPDLVALDNDFAFRDGLIVGHDQHRVVLVGIEFDHRAAAHPEELVHGDHRAAQNHRDFDFDVVDIVQHEPYPGQRSKSLGRHGFGNVNFGAGMGY